jgi:hypothetical protein
LAFNATSCALYGFGDVTQGINVLEKITPVILEDRQDVFAVVFRPLVQPGIRVQTVTADEIEGSWKNAVNTVQEANCRRDFVFTWPYRLGVEEYIEVFGEQVSRDMTVVILNALAAFRANDTLKTPRTAPQVGGMRFMGVKNERDQTVAAWSNRLGPFETPVDRSIDVSNCLMVY